ncbi:hypothetical protein GCM10010402_66190 [Actinomadura luteofluorescens]|uniref:hypothetical protein n=1 Tax=Actinomadura luteofluorescens TaxID=46163 RepID=UPI0021643F3B|nr:hypothetical protein [Actinomadura glauciflava]MCR3744209.1 hypothetical protein [Actinomadura glauciflava]
MKNWTEMSAADFYTKGAQLDMFAGIEGDGCGTLDLLAAAAEAEAAAEAAPVVDEGREDGALFGLTVSEVPADGALFSVVAA